jgi:hypothetical protein
MGMEAHPSHSTVPAAGFGWRIQAVIVLGLRVSYLLLDAVRTDGAVVIPTALDYLSYKGDELLRVVLSTPVLVAALQLVERLPRTWPRRGAAAIVAMQAAAVVAVLLMAYGLPWEPVAVRLGASATTAVWFWYSLWMTALSALLALVIIDRLNARRDATRRLADLQQRARLVRQRRAYAQLQAIQARVDPQLLFEMLAAVKRAYQSDAVRAEHLLDELAAFLRAALPRLRSVRSSLEIEFGLVGSYVRMLRTAAAASIRLQPSLPAALANAVFPAGLLLPLISRPAAAGAERRIALAAYADDPAWLRVRITDDAAPDASALQRVQASLADLYGEPARLHVEPTAAGVMIELELPREDP